MIKLPTWIEFAEHEMFQEDCGLCLNTFKVIAPHDEACGTDFGDFLEHQGLKPSYPIKKGGYVKTSQSISESSDLYYITRDTGTLYLGMQGALRHNLYKRYIRWLVEKFPELFCM